MPKTGLHHGVLRGLHSPSNTLAAPCPRYYGNLRSYRSQVTTLLDRTLPLSQALVLSACLTSVMRRRGTAAMVCEVAEDAAEMPAGLARERVPTAYPHVPSRPQ